MIHECDEECHEIHVGFLQKVHGIIQESRINPLSSTERWFHDDRFNLHTISGASTLESITATTASSSYYHHPLELFTVLAVEGPLFMPCDEGSLRPIPNQWNSIILEHWKVTFEPLEVHGTTLESFEKHAHILIRTIYSLTRLLPTRRLVNLPGINLNTVATIINKEGGVLPLEESIWEEGAFESSSFVRLTPVATPHGLFQVTVRYRKAARFQTTNGIDETDETIKGFRSTMASSTASNIAISTPSSSATTTRSSSIVGMTSIGATAIPTAMLSSRIASMRINEHDDSLASNTSEHPSSSSSSGNDYQQQKQHNQQQHRHEKKENANDLGTLDRSSFENVELEPVGMPASLPTGKTSNFMTFASSFRGTNFNIPLPIEKGRRSRSLQSMATSPLAVHPAAAKITAQAMALETIQRRASVPQEVDKKVPSSLPNLIATGPAPLIVERNPMMSRSRTLATISTAVTHHASNNSDDYNHSSSPSQSSDSEPKFGGERKLDQLFNEIKALRRQIPHKAAISLPNPYELLDRAKRIHAMLTNRIESLKTGNSKKSPKPQNRHNVNNSDDDNDNHNDKSGISGEGGYDSTRASSLLKQIEDDDDEEFGALFELEDIAQGSASPNIETSHNNTNDRNNKSYPL